MRESARVVKALEVPPTSRTFRRFMHAFAPILIIAGVMAVALGLFWIVAANAEEDGGPDLAWTFLFGWYHLGVRILRALLTEPMSVLPGFGFLAAGVGLIWLGVRMF